MVVEKNIAIQYSKRDQRNSVSERTTRIKDCLEVLYDRYNRREFIGSDPLQFVYEYSNPADMEVVALLAADLAYGRVQQIQKSLANLLGRMGKSPYAFVRDFGKAERRSLSGFKHRFTTDRHISDLLMLLKKVLSRYARIEDFFIRGYNRGDKNIVPALVKFCETLYAMHAREHDGKVSRGLKYLLTSPSGGSVCKRLNLFLRWMVRDDDVDVGLWKSIDKSKLIVPVDVHMSRLCNILGFHDRKTVSLSTAIKITESFAQIESKDPVKYDFALTRVGIIEDCDGNYRPNCRDCKLSDFCC
ncbi:MAG: TIGR02757 family protein [Phycisphaerae bacterium]|nr:TIGR02757 family protein [Phycisphaerae bacterium]NIR62445.1 TIGR02757 family protein [candidate division Zixibacteria bacterium]NIP55814.1 TIGR02757 family protein [Phycisphaerae bacterium]NIS50302.1 TIGR02757 family protein [Phycisphaerae bacterium]NIU08047.1 TIGR02757 family protein [Phycisphaerae bacterium]